jgi:GNAT superfamily N-acetyltransferase
MPVADKHSASQVSICRWEEVPDTTRLGPELDAIFFEASGTKLFASAADRAAFRERWLGRYLTYEPGWAYLAMAPDGSIAGYLVGSIEDPATSERFGNIGYFRDFADLTVRYPAHIHVNLAPDYRNRGIGGQLIDAFAADAARAGAKGMHVVTGAASRNVRFYARNGFRELGRSRLNGHEVVLLGRGLDTPETA